MSWGERGGRLSFGLNPSRVLVIAALFIVAYCCVAIATNAVNHYELARNQEQLRQEIATLEGQKAQLNALKSYMQSDEFIERAAREEGLTRPGDTVVLVAAPTPSATPDASAPGPWWERYFGPDQR